MHPKGEVDVMSSFPYEKIEKKIGYIFQDKGLLRQAFTRSSYTNEKGRDAYQSNQVLEFFGDSVLSCALVTLLERDFSKRYEHGVMTELTEGDFSNMKSKLSDKTKLSHVSDALGLAPYLLLGEGDKKRGVASEASVLEDLYESIIGAIWIDSGHDIETVVGVVEKTLDFRAFALGGKMQIQSYKNALQEYCQHKSRRLAFPEYTVVEKRGEDHAPIYRVECRVSPYPPAFGEGISVKKAENAAAELLLRQLRTGEKPASIKGERGHPADSFVSKLQRYADKTHKSFSFSEAKQTENAGKVIFVVHCSFGAETTTAFAVSKSEAKQKAAQKMLQHLGLCK